MVGCGYRSPCGTPLPNAHLPPNMQAGAGERQRVVVCTLGAIAAGLVGGGYISFGMMGCTR